MKKSLLIVSFALLSFVNVKASNHAFDLTANSANYLKSTSAPLSGNAEFTMEFWFNNDGNSYQSYARLLGFTNYGCELGLNNGTLMFYNGASWKTTSANNLNTGWHHVAITNNLTEVIIYVDGTEQYRVQSPTFNFSSKIFYIGNSYGTNSYDGIKGYFDEIRIWKRAKDLPEILNSMDKQLVGTESDLIAYYPMLNQSFNDASSTGNNLTYSSSTGTKAFDFGDYINDYSLNFDGSDDRCNVTSPLTGDTDFTLEAQFKSTNTTSGAYRRIFAWTSYGFEIALVNGTIQTYKTSWQTTSTSNLNDGNWHHVAVTKSGSAIIVYVDGIQVAQRTASVNLTGTMTIGGLYSPVNGDMFIGQIDEVRVWDATRSLSEIQTYMDSTLVGNETNLVAYYDMNTVDTAVKNLVAGGNSLSRLGTSGSNNLPPFTDISSKTITPIIISTVDGISCGAGTVNLSAISNSGTINWYDAPTAGNLVGSGTSFISPSISSTTIYYVDVEKNGFTSANRVAVTANVNTIPQITSTTPNEICGTNSIVLSAIADAGTLNWYSVSTGGTSLGTGSNFTTNSISSTTSFYVDATDNGCTSLRSEVVATINPLPIITSATPAYSCGAGTVTLHATSDVGTITWKDGDNQTVGTGTSFTTLNLSSDASYYVTSDDGTCTSDEVEIVATIHSVPSITTTLDAENCGDGSVILEAYSDFGDVTWYNSSSEGLYLGTGDSYTTSNLSSTTSFYASAVDGDCASPRVEVIATINPLPSINVSQTNETLEVVSTTNATYQWIDCDNESAIITNEVNSTYAATENGNYAVVVMLDQCEATSDCFSITSALVNELETTNFDVYPNPSHSYVTITSTNNANQIVEVISMTGSVVYSSEFSSNHKVDVSEINAGIYTVRIQNNSSVSTKLLIIE